MIKTHDKSLSDEIDVQCCMFALSAVQVDTCDDSALSSIADAAATATLVPRNCVQNKAVSPSSTSNTLCWWRPVPNISQRWCNARDGNRNNLYGLLNSRYALPFTKPLQVSCNLFSLQRVNHCAGSGTTACHLGLGPRDVVVGRSRFRAVGSPSDTECSVTPGSYLATERNVTFLSD